MTKIVPTISKWLFFFTFYTVASGRLHPWFWISKQIEESGKGNKVKNLGVSLVAQWLRIRLSIQETHVQSMSCEDPTRLDATSPGTATTKPVLQSPEPSD